MNKHSVAVALRRLSSWKRALVFTAACMSVELLAPASAAGDSIYEQQLKQADVPQFLDKATCIACHGMSEVRVGPPWVAISARYKNADRDQVEALVAKIRVGGSGNWGTVPMIAYPQIKPKNAEVIVQWLKSLDIERAMKQEAPAAP